MSKKIIMTAILMAMFCKCEYSYPVYSNDGRGYDVVCIQGVSYYRRVVGASSLMAVALDRNSKVILCDDNVKGK